MLYSHSDLTNCDDVRPHSGFVGSAQATASERSTDLAGITDSISPYRISWSSVESIRSAIRELIGDLIPTKLANRRGVGRPGGK